jgi:hypothetical protein
MWYIDLFFYFFFYNMCGGAKFYNGIITTCVSFVKKKKGL